MKLSILQPALAKAVSTVSRVVPSKGIMPILENVLLRAEGDTLTLTGTNLELGVVCQTPAIVNHPGSITVPAKRLAECVNALPNDNVIMHLHPTTNVLALRCGRLDFAINGLPADEYPPVDTAADVEQRIVIDTRTLRESIEQTTFAASTDDTRPILMGVFVKLEKGAGVFVAADGFRMSIRQVSLQEEIDENIEIIIPANSLNEVLRHLRDADDNVEIIVPSGQNRVVFDMGRVTVISQLISGLYFDYSRFIPQSHETECIVSLPNFSKAVKAASIFAKDNGIVRLRIRAGEDLLPGCLTLSAREEDKGENVGELDAIVEGGSNQIAIHSKYLLGVLAALDSAQVELRIIGPSHACTLRATGSDAFTHIMMPMFVNW